MTVPIIHVHTQADKNTFPFVRFMWDTLVSLANHPDRLRLIAHCMGPTAAAKIETWLSAEKGRALVVPDPRGDLKGSKGHGACIMSALAMTGDGSIHVVCDSDTVIVAKGWDDYVRQRTITDGIGMIGTTYEDVGGFSSGKSTTQTYKKAPTFTWAALTPLHNWGGLDVMPNKSHTIKINTPQLSQIYGLPIGYSVFGEAAWQVPQYLYDYDLRNESWQQLKPTKDAVVLKGLSDYHEEFHAGGAPFVVHHRGSMRHAYRGDKLSKAFYSTVDAYLATELSRKAPRWTWSDPNSIKSLGPVALPRGLVPPEARRTVPEPVAVAPPATPVKEEKEWLKVTFNSTVTRPRKDVDRGGQGIDLKFARPAMGSISFVRVEGALNHGCLTIVPATPAEPYLLTYRNATLCTLVVSTGNGSTVSVQPNSTVWLLIDVDGVQRVE